MAKKDENQNSGGEQSTDSKPLEGVQPAGVVEAGGREAHTQHVEGDPHAHEAIPGAKGVEAIGSGQPLPDKALDGFDDRRQAGVPEPPKVGPIPNVDLYDTPGGYQAVPAGLKPYEVGAAAAVVRPQRRTSAEDTGAEVKHVAGPGSRTTKG